jgi:hypothetical protein
MNAGAAALEARGLRVCTVDLLPNDTIRYHLSPPTDDAADLDRELAEFKARNDQG